MSKNCLLRLITLITIFCTLPLAAQNTPIPNWTVPANRHNAVTNTDLSNAAAVVAITPCRRVDTRNAPGTYGGPGFSPNETRSYPVPSGPCSGIPIAAAYSLNFTIVSYSAGTFLTAYTTGLPRPFVSTVNAGGGSPVANAAIVPASGNGSFDVYA